MVFKTLVLIFIFFSTCGASQLNKSIDKKIVIGSIENISVLPLNLRFKARIDTGAKTSSIDAQNIKEFDKDGKKWVKFSLKDSDNHLIEQTYLVSRIVNIKSGVNKKPQKRYVVKMRVKLGKVERIIDVSLNDRTHLKYPFLVGRNFLNGNFIVDVSHSYVIDNTD